MRRVSYLGEEAVREADPDLVSNVKPRGVVQSQDLDFSYYYIDCGKIK